MLDSEKKGKLATMLPSRSNLLIWSALLIFAGPSWGQANLETRAKPSAKTEPRPQANIRIDSNLVLIPVTVTDPMNRFVTGLEKDSFKLFEDNLRKK